MQQQDLAISQSKSRTVTNLGLPPLDGITVPQHNMEHVTGIPTVLQDTLERASFVTLAPVFYQLSRIIHENQPDLMDRLRENIAMVQDALVEVLNTAFENVGATPYAKTTLGLNTEGTLTIIGDHPEKQCLQAILTVHPEITTAFKELAVLAELEHHLTMLRTITYSAAGLDAYAALRTKFATAQRDYCLSLKGDMSHFYFRLHAH